MAALLMTGAVYQESRKKNGGHLRLSPSNGARFHGAGAMGESRSNWPPIEKNVQKENRAQIDPDSESNRDKLRKGQFLKLVRFFFVAISRFREIVESRNRETP